MKSLERFLAAEDSCSFLLAVGVQHLIGYFSAHFLAFVVEKTICSLWTFLLFPSRCVGRRLIRLVAQRNGPLVFSGPRPGSGVWKNFSTVIFSSGPAEPDGVLFFITVVTNRFRPKTN